MRNSIAAVLVFPPPSLSAPDFFFKHSQHVHFLAKAGFQKSEGLSSLFHCCWCPKFADAPLQAKYVTGLFSKIKPVSNPQPPVAVPMLWLSILMLLHHSLFLLLLTATSVDGLGAISSYANAGLRSSFSRFQSHAVNFSWNPGSLWTCQTCLL